MRTLDFHEDDIGQVQIVAASNREWCEEELRKLNAFAKAHQDPDGAGWTDMYIRNQEPDALSTLGLDRDRIAAGLDEIAESFDHISAGWGDKREPIKRTDAYGPSDGAAIIAHYDDDGSIEMLWCILPPPTTPDSWVMAHLLSELGKVEPLILVDWAEAKVVDLSSPEQIASYVKYGEAAGVSHDRPGEATHILTGRVARWLPIIGLSGGLTLLCWLVLDPGLKRQIAVACGALITLIGIVPALPGAFRLRLLKDGFEVTTFWRREFWNWKDVEHFRVIRPYRDDLVGWNIRRENDPEDIGLFAGLPPVDGRLSDTYGMDAQDLADLMEAWRARGLPDEA